MDAQIKNNTMKPKTYFQQLTDFLTPLMISGKLTKDEINHIIDLFINAENHAHESGKQYAEEQRFSREHAENNNYDRVDKDEIYENVKINGEGEE